MQVRELRERLARFPDEAIVAVSCPYGDGGWCRTSGPVTSVRSRDDDDDWFEPNGEMVVLVEADKVEGEDP